MGASVRVFKAGLPPLPSIYVKQMGFWISFDYPPMCCSAPARVAAQNMEIRTALLIFACSTDFTTYTHTCIDVRFPFIIDNSIYILRDALPERTSDQTYPIHTYKQASFSDFLSYLFSRHYRVLYIYTLHVCRENIMLVGDPSLDMSPAVCRNKCIGCAKRHIARMSDMCEIGYMRAASSVAAMWNTWINRVSAPPPTPPPLPAASQSIVYTILFRILYPILLQYLHYININSKAYLKTFILHCE